MIQTLFGSLEEEQKPSFLDRMKEAVTRTRENLAERIEEAVSFSKEIDRNTLDDLEATLIGADLGTTTTHEVLEKLREKADRKRDTEFENPPATRAALMKVWEEGWNEIFAALDPLSDSDLNRTVVIRGEPHSVMQAINRQIAHYAYHCGQIVFLAKHFRSNEWKTLTVPRGKSEEFNRMALEKAKN